jgi:hypothetical protein
MKAACASIAEPVAEHCPAPERDLLILATFKGAPLPNRPFAFRAGE